MGEMPCPAKRSHPTGSTTLELVESRLFRKWRSPLLPHNATKFIELINHVLFWHEHGDAAHIHPDHAGPERSAVH
jgi:hypothetical protein